MDTVGSLVGDVTDTLDVRAEGLQQLEARKKKKNATAAAAAKAAKASSAATRSLPLAILADEERRDVMGSLDVRTLEERKKKNATAAAAAKAAKASAKAAKASTAARSVPLFDERDVEEEEDAEKRGLLDTATGAVGDLVGDVEGVAGGLDVRAEGLKLEERKKKKNATAAAAAKAAKASSAARSFPLFSERELQDVKERGLLDTATGAVDGVTGAVGGLVGDVEGVAGGLDVRAEGLKLEERKKKKNATAATAAKAAKASSAARSVDLFEVVKREDTEAEDEEE